MSSIEGSASAVEQLATEAHEARWRVGQAGQEVFSPYMSSLLQLDFIELAQYNLNHYSDIYFCEFILSTPQLWAELPTAVWIELLKTNTPRVQPPKSISPIGSNGDIVLLHRFFGVDAIHFMVSHDYFSNLDKRNILEYFSRNWYLLMPSEFDSQDLDGEYFVDRSVVESTRSRLRLEHGFAFASDTAEDLQSKLAVLAEKIDNE